MVGPDPAETYIVRLARTFSKAWDCSVTVGGAACYTDLEHRSIHLPATADYLDAPGRAALQGYLDHEAAGHLLAESEFVGDERPSAVLRSLRGRSKAKILARLFNVVEDIRIEAAASARWPGVGINLEAARCHAYARLAKIYTETPEAMSSLLLLGAGFIARASGNEDKIPWLPKEVTTLLDELNDEIAAARAARSPRESMVVADAILARLKTAVAAEDKGGDASAGGSGALARRVMADADDGSEPSPMHEGLKALVEEAWHAAMEVPGRYLVHPGLLALDRVGPPPKNKYLRVRFEKESLEASTVVGGVSARVAALLRTRAPERRADMDRGRVDSRALPSVRLGETRVFVQELPAEGLDTAVTLLVDQSGSMAGNRMKVARQCSWALGEALDRAGSVAFEVLGWHDADPHPEFDGKELYSRIEARRLYVYKAFRESWPRTRHRVATMESGYNNDDAGAVYAAASRLAVRAERRKILLVLSDGAPCHLACDMPVSRGHLKVAVRRCVDAGIEVAAVGIESDYGTDLYPHWRSVYKLEELPATALDLLTRLVRPRSGLEGESRCRH